MKKQTLFLVALFIIAAIALIGCNKKEEVSSDKVVVYGFVSDSKSGESLSNVKITCDYEDNKTEEIKTVATTVTGSDGTYEFTITNIDKKQIYVVSGDKDGYYGTDEILTFDNPDDNGKIKCDLQLSKQ